MKQKVFTNGNEKDGRDILIVIEPEFAMFYFNDNYNSHKEWVMQEEERRRECGEEYLSEDEKTCCEFYWIGKDDWNRRLDNWEQHLEYKAWFTPQMFDFLNEGLTTK